MKRIIIILSAILLILILWDWTHENPGSASRTNAVPARVGEVNAFSKPTAKTRRPMRTQVNVPADQPTSTEEDDPLYEDLSAEQIEAYLAKTKRSADGLINAFLETGETNFLAEAVEKYPNDPIVQWTMLTKASSAEERTQWLEKLKASSPDNALPHYLSALDSLKGENPGQAWAEIDAARAKGINSFEKERIQSSEELYLLSEYSPLEAKQRAMYSLLLPELAQMKALALEIRDLGAGYRASGDSAATATWTAAGIDIARQYSSNPQTTLVGQLVGFAMENALLKDLDADTYYDFLGQTAGQRLEQLKSQKQEIRDLSTTFLVDYANLSDVEKTIYLNRSSLYGELNALRWMKNRK